MEYSTSTLSFLVYARMGCKLHGVVARAQGKGKGGGGVGTGVHSGFKVMGMCEGFFGFKIFDSGIFCVRPFRQVFSCGGLSEVWGIFGYSKQYEGWL